ncbi:MAG: hypothetical protein EA401_12955 [Planctomycetota bacterium]|nr:MAG: hypothetical protein EA401_12955 [Planctomycetota bacterium]
MNNSVKPHGVYCHGFASSPRTTAKGQALREALAPECASFELPYLQRGEFVDLRMDGMAEALHEHLATLPDDGAPLLLCGSSLGAYLVAWQASLGLPRPAALLLIAPAFTFVSKWRQLLGEEALAQWRQEGTRRFYHYGEKRELPLGVGFIDSCEGLPDVPQATGLPTVVIHGRHDETAPWPQALGYAGAASHGEFHLLDDGHSLEGPEAMALILSRGRALLRRLQSPAEQP